MKAHAPHCRVIFTVYEMKRPGRDAAELTALADHLTAHGLVLEMLAGPLPGMCDPSGAGRLLFAFFAAMAETEREEGGIPRGRRSGTRRLRRPPGHRVVGKLNPDRGRGHGVRRPGACSGQPGS
ncbi:recombinase family protein [Streptomyces sp.]|uniref:recombinase family protein n=1 Tax=Streptomyces sp. TaxID=1931 RepID=UPI002F9391C7